MSIFTQNIATSIPFGLDLGDLSIKAVQIVHGKKRDEIKGYASASLPFGYIQDGEILKSNEVAQVIREMLDDAQPKAIRSKQVICSLPETKAFLRIIQIPKMDLEEAKEAVRWEMEANIPLTADEVYYDWQIVSNSIKEDKGKMNVLLVAVARKTVEQIVDVLEKADLEVVGLEIESMAQSRSLINSQNKEETVMVVDIGDRRTGILIVANGVPVFTSSIAQSGQSLTDAIAKSFNMSNEEAEKTKIEHGIGSSTKGDPLFQSVKPVLESFVVEMQRSIEFLVSGLEYDNTVDRVIISGGGANTKGFIPYLAQRMQKTVEIGNPWSKILLGSNLPPIARQDAAQYTTAIGLALKELYYDHKT
ncbi:MAG: type IV pilus assembly protein PilM [Candidatus Moranbacteria bacterium]|nr:type IV pilus assembly protein PilM [Candidatus Moranbacteria bacterium]